MSGKLSGKTSEKILTLIKENQQITIAELAEKIGVTDRTIERNIQTLKEKQLLRREGGAKGGYWQVIEQ